MSKNNETKKEMENVIETICAAVNEENKNNNKKENKEMEDNKNNKIENNNKKENKEMKDNNERKTKNDLDWLTGGTASSNKTYSNKSKEKITNKIVKISSNILDVTILTINDKIKYTLTHKQTKKGTVKVTIESKQFETMTLKFKEEPKLEEGILMKDIRIVKEDSKVDYEKDYIVVNNMAIPFEALINPLFDFYIEDKKIRRRLVMYTEGTIKINEDKITMDARLRKMDYLVDGRSMTLEDLQELEKENEDNKMGVSLEMTRRYAITNGEDIQYDELNDLTAPDKVVALIENYDPNKKVELIRAIDDNNTCMKLVEILKGMTDEQTNPIVEIFKNKDNAASLKSVLKLTDKQIELVIDYKNTVIEKSVVRVNKLRKVSAAEKLIKILIDNGVKKADIIRAIDDNQMYKLLSKVMFNLKDESIDKIINILKDANNINEIKAVFKLTNQEIMNLLECKNLKAMMEEYKKAEAQRIAAEREAKIAKEREAKLAKEREAQNKVMRDVERVRDAVNSEAMNNLCATTGKGIFGQIESVVAELKTKLTNNEIKMMKNSIINNIVPKLIKVYTYYDKYELGEMLDKQISVACK